MRICPLVSRISPLPVPEPLPTFTPTVTVEGSTFLAVSVITVGSVEFRLLLLVVPELLDALELTAPEPPQRCFLQL